MQSMRVEPYRAYSVASSWFVRDGHDVTDVRGVSLGVSQQIDLVEQLIGVTAGSKRGWRGTLRRHGLAWPARYWASKAAGIRHPWRGAQGAVAMVFDVDNKPTIRTLNILAAELVRRGQRVVGIVADPHVRELLVDDIEPVYFNDRAPISASRWLRPGHTLDLDTCHHYARQALGGLELGGDARRRLSRRLVRSLRFALEDLDALESLSARGGFTALVSGCDLHRLSALAIQIARREGLPSFVLQHGIPILPHAYVPPVADRVCTWGEISKEWFCRHGVDAARLMVTGCPRYDELVDRQPASSEHRSLVLLSTAIVEDRLAPLVDSFLTLPMEAFGSVVIKMHPSESSHAFYRQRIAARDLSDRVHLEQTTPIARLMAPGDIAVVASSSSGVDAILAGGLVADVTLAGLTSPIDYERHGVGVRTDAGGLRAAVGELVARASSSELGTNRKRFLDDHLSFAGGAAAPRIADAIIEAIRQA